MSLYGKFTENNDGAIGYNACISTLINIIDVCPSRELQLCILHMYIWKNILSRSYPWILLLLGKMI